MLPEMLFIGKINVDLYTRIQTAQENDNFAATIRNAKLLKIPSPFRFSLDDWTTDSGLLRYQKRVYIPDQINIKREILQMFHDLPSFGHPGLFKTAQLIQQHYWWPGLTVFIKNYIGGCALCQQMKINMHPTKPPLLPIPTDPMMLPFQSVSMDFITDLPLSNHYDSIMVIVDHDSSKGIILIPCTKMLDALGTAKLYHDNVYKCFGLPKRIISDRGPQFASQVFQTLCTRLGIKSKLSTAYHPQMDGQTERTNQEVEAYLCIYCGTSPHSWADSLTDLEFSHNIQTHSVTKTSPFNIILRYDPIPIPPVIEDTQIPSLSLHLRLLSSNWKEALAAHDLARAHMVRYGSHGFQPFKLGDKVWLEATNLHFPNRLLLSPLNYRLKLPPAWKIHPIFHASLLSTYTETDIHGPPFTQPPPDQIEGHQEFEIEAIISHKGNGNQRQFLVKWTRYPSSENQWLPETELSHATKLLKTYKKQKNL
ncbi:hypothetical protein M0805_008605 [Coniferiporia weirii]|nr:hypothetical protein M0805_008605 [Coniferiporia weirii]